MHTVLSTLGITIDPFTFTHNNVIGTHILLDAALSYGKIARFVHVSTDQTYGETDGVFATKSHPLGPTNPYSASKAATEMYVNAYYKSFDISAIIVRSNKAYGPCQYPKKIISVLEKNTRRYRYASDAADAFDTVLHRGFEGEIYDIDSAYEVDNLSVASKVPVHFGRDFDSSIDWVSDCPFNDSKNRVNGTK
ncbi:hypothetical protein BKA66DRAFT_609346 [Pyrenochaeta sp. MPI-SDFR-AT-0127]|nr:hypothetical protein BKA66DRAFT_609346 [Pyrenochaeta sp. MPI-SDFR-AT-0127]